MTTPTTAGPVKRTARPVTTAGRCRCRRRRGDVGYTELVQGLLVGGVGHRRGGALIGVGLRHRGVGVKADDLPTVAHQLQGGR
jgi:hypothetical protein